MPITFTCRSCGKGYTVPDAMGGRPTRCKRCRAKGTVPTVREAEAAAAAEARRDEDAIATIGAGSASDVKPATRMPGGRTAAWVRQCVARLDRTRRRTMWAWAVVLTALVLLVLQVWRR